MFTWVCQRCGREVDVAQTRCPNCEPAAGEDVALGSARGAPAEAAPQSAPKKESPAPVATQAEQPPAPQRLPEPAEADPPPGPAAPEPPADVFSLRASHLLLFGFALLAAMAVAVGMSQPELLTEWRESLTAPAEPAEGAPVALPAPGPIEVAGLRAWRDEKAEVRIRATLVNHQMSPAPELEYEVAVFARVGEGQGRLLGSFSVQLDEPIEGRSSQEVEAPLNAPDGLADFPHWSELVGRVGSPQAAPEKSGE